MKLGKCSFGEGVSQAWMEQIQSLYESELILNVIAGFILSLVTAWFNISVLSVL